jgi:hypothetical protein
MDQTDPANPDLGSNPSREVRAAFTSPGQLNEAVTRLIVNGFSRNHIRLPEALPPDEALIPEDEALAEHVDHRQPGMLPTIMATSVAAAAAGVTAVATGGLAAPVVAATLLAGSALGATYAAGSASTSVDAGSRGTDAPPAALSLAVRVESPIQQKLADGILKAGGAFEICVADVP